MKHIQYNGAEHILVRERNGVAELFSGTGDIKLVKQSELDYSTLTMKEQRLVPGSLLLPERPEGWLTAWREERLRKIAENIKTRKVEKSSAGPSEPKVRKPRTKASTDDQLLAKANEMIRLKLLAAQKTNPNL